MSSHKHTPGPWTIAPHEGAEPSFDIRVPMGQYIATLQDHFTGHGEANARLIAAAPDLLEALREFIECGPNAGHNSELRALALSAVAKATGGAE